MELQERDDRWIIPVGDGEVVRVSLDYARVTVMCDAVAINIGGRMVITSPSGELAEVDPDPGVNSPISLAPVLPVLRNTIQEVIAFKTGGLFIGFADGSEIEVPADPDYEAWEAVELGNAQGLRVISGPGGKLTIWQGDRGLSGQANVLRIGHSRCARSDEARTPSL